MVIYIYIYIYGYFRELKAALRGSYYLQGMFQALETLDS